MEARTLRLLEYDKIRDQVRAHAASSLGQALVERMKPLRDPLLVRTRQQETTEARRLLAEADAPFGGLHDVREALRRSEKLGVLTAAELQDIADAAACCRRLRRYVVVEDVPLLRAQGELLGDFRALEAAIDRAIAPNGEVLDIASAELAAQRRRVRHLH
jgi:DNA mismatch repair protein MutS2